MIESRLHHLLSRIACDGMAAALVVFLRPLVPRAGADGGEKDRDCIERRRCLELVPEVIGAVPHLLQPSSNAHEHVVGRAARLLERMRR